MSRGKTGTASHYFRFLLKGHTLTRTPQILAPIPGRSLFRSVCSTAMPTVIDDKTRLIVSLAAVLHDIGAIEARRKHGSMEGRFQEIEGPTIARVILDRAGVQPGISERVCHIVGNHHTPGKIDGTDFQILWEADYLESLQFGEEGKDPETRRLKVAENFRTAAGRRLAQERLGIL